MDLIDESDLENVPAFPQRQDVRDVSDEEFRALVKRLASDPVGNLEELATRVQLIVQERITREKNGPTGEISVQTRAWMQMLMDAIEKIHKARFGEKRVNINAQVITHSDLADFVRQNAPTNIKEAEVVDEG